MCRKLQPHRLLDQLDIARAKDLIRHYTINHAVWAGDYYPKTTVFIQLPTDTANSTIDRLCVHIETNYTVHVWNREYIQKTITLAYTNVDYCTS